MGAMRETFEYQRRRRAQIGAARRSDHLGLHLPLVASNPESPKAFALRNNWPPAHPPLRDERPLGGLAPMGKVPRFLHVATRTRRWGAAGRKSLYRRDAVVSGHPRQNLRASGQAFRLGNRQRRQRGYPDLLRKRDSR